MQKPDFLLMSFVVHFLSLSVPSMIMEIYVAPYAFLLPSMKFLLACEFWKNFFSIVLKNEKAIFHSSSSLPTVHLFFEPVQGTVACVTSHRCWVGSIPRLESRWGQEFSALYLGWLGSTQSSWRKINCY